MVTVERSEGVARLRYAHDPGDLLTAAGLVALRQAFDAVDVDPDVRVIVFGGPPGRFPLQMDPDDALRMVAAAPRLPPRLASAGVDLLVAACRWAPALKRLLGGEARAVSTGFVHVRLLLDAMERTDKLTIAALDGPAFGGGLELALACDWRVAADRPDGWIAQPEILAGVMAGFGATQRLPALVGPARALELLVGGEAITPATALAWGLVHRLFPAQGYDGAVQALAATLARRPAGALRGTLRATRPRVNAGRELVPMLGVWAGAEAEAGLRAAASLVRDELARPVRRPLPELLAELDRRP